MAASRPYYCIIDCWKKSEKYRKGTSTSPIGPTSFHRKIFASVLCLAHSMDWKINYN